MSKVLKIMMVLVISLSSGLLLLGSACKTATTTTAGVMLPNSTTQPPTTASQAIMPYIPPSYYVCSETTPENLCNAYFSRYFNIAYADTEFNGQVFVFKNMVITQSELNYATPDYMWVDGVIQCYFLTSGSASQLKAGETVDIVGVDAGINQDYAGTLTFAGCIFLPAGSVELPPGGTSALIVTGY